jgi:peptide/nickel transport system substrate-binding protein
MFAGSNDPSVQKTAITQLENIMSTQVPVAPLLYGAAWWEYSTRNYTGWPSSTNPFINPTTNSPYLEETILHLTPVH